MAKEKAIISGRHIALDENKHEWMSVAQYTRAIMIDFDTQCSNTVVSLAKKNLKGITKDDLKKLSGKNCINYTSTVLDFFDAHPMIAPEIETLKAWRKKLPRSAKKKVKTIESATKKTVKKKTTRLGTKPDDDDKFISAAEEKAKHEKIKRKKAEFELDVIQGNFIHLDDLIPALQTIAIETRQRILSIVPRIAPTLLAEKDPHMIKIKLEKELIAALNMVENIEDIIDGAFQEAQAKEQLEELDND